MANALAKKMALILGEVSRIPKNGKNTFQNYQYTTESDTLDAIRPLLSKHGIAVFYECIEVQDLENCRTRVKVQFELIDGDSGDSKTMICYGEARDADKQGKTQDKGIYKAMTGACKYWLFKTFLISTGDDPEDEKEMIERDDRRSHGSVKPLTAPPKSPPQKPAPAIAPVAGLIGKDEQLALVAASQKSGFTKDAMVALLATYNFTKSADVTTEFYPAILEKAKDPEQAQLWNKFVTEQQAEVV